MTVTLCVLLWANDGQHDALIAYEDSVLALIPAHGGRVLQRMRTAGDPDGPLEVHVLEFPSEHALDDYMNSDRRLALADDRERAIALTEIHRVNVI